MMYDWVRPRIAIPAHGEALHLTEHATFAKAQGVPHVFQAGNGDMVALSERGAEKIDHVAAGRIYQDGRIQISALDKTIPERRKLAVAGIVSVAIAIDEKGMLAGDPEIALMGLPAKARDGTTFDEIVSEAVEDLMENLPKARRRDPENIRTSLEKAVRGAVAQEWDKKPVVHVMVVEV